MDNEKLEKADNIRQRIFNRIAGVYFRTAPIDERPILGSLYDRNLSMLVEEINEICLGMVAELSDLSEDDLAHHFSRFGEPTSEKWQVWAQKHKKAVDDFIRRLTFWDIAVLGGRRFPANYEYWAKSPFLTLDEALWLSVGLEPRPDFQISMSATGYKPNYNLTTDHMTQRHELFRRELDLHNEIKNHAPMDILEWINRVELDVHAGFRKMLELMIRRKKTEQTVATAQIEVIGGIELNCESREKASLSKLLLAMAIREYGYDPDARRSPIPKQMQDLAAELGLSVSLDTIRQYLQMGEKHLPKGWRANS